MSLEYINVMQAELDFVEKDFPTDEEIITMAIYYGENQFPRSFLFYYIVIIFI